jgi:NADPH-dependent 2,4-dienoyl-CoA reductase/sulfur reductase-like enzyme
MEIDLKQSRLLVRQKQGQTHWESFDRLMLSTGAVSAHPPVEGIGAEGVFGITTLQSGLDLMQFISGEQPRSAVVIGGGYIGLEMAENLLLRNMKVTLIEKEAEVMGTLDPDMGALVSQSLMDMGILLYRNEALQSIETKKNRVRAIVTDHRTIPADLVILGLGVRPNVHLAKSAGMELGSSGAVKVDETMRTTTENVWAGGDCAESFHLVSRRPVNIPLGTVANKHGRVAGSNIGGEHAVFPGLVGTAITRIGSTEVARTGLQEKEIQQTGKQYISAVTNSMTKADYYPGSGPIAVKILAEKDSGRLLGGQIVGKAGAAKRIDVLVAALHAGMTLEEIADLDLSYAPPYSPLWDPVALAARIALKKLA